MEAVLPKSLNPLSGRLQTRASKQQLNAQRPVLAGAFTDIPDRGMPYSPRGHSVAALRLLGQASRYPFQEGIWYEYVRLTPAKRVHCKCILVLCR